MMTIDTKRLASEIIQKFYAEVEDGLKKAYQAGSIETRNSIMRAAGLPIAEDIPATPNKSHSTSAKRAPLGLVGKTVAIVLKSHPEGLTVSDLSQKVVNQDYRIAIGSIPNEINRHLGKKYRREDGLIFLFSNGADQKKTEGAANNDIPSAHA